MLELLPLASDYHTHSSINAPDSIEGFKVVREWLTTCTIRHKLCRKTISGASVRDELPGNPLPKRVIDVGDDQGTPPRLVATGEQMGIYLALSYCWGSKDQSQPLQTTKSTISDFEKAIPFALLPATIRDAIITTRRLGIRMLWIDTLCIIQDDELDWRHESANMGRIFQLALCTLAATAARHSGEGLFFPRNSGTENQLDDLGGELARCEWGKRGWVVQERILSRRLVHFASQQLFYECQEAVFAQSENTPTPFTQHLQSKPQIFHRLMLEATAIARMTNGNRMLQTLRVIAGLGKNRFLPWSKPTSDRVHSAQHRFWSRVVRTYNQCDLTRASDKLPALAGLAQELSALTLQRYFQGLWIEDIARGLFWCAAHNPLSRLKGAQAPSWSWAAWKGQTRMATYYAEYDTGRPWVYKTNSTNYGTLHLSAHFWKASRVRSGRPAEFFDNWVMQDWWTHPGKEENDILRDLPRFNRHVTQRDPAYGRSHSVRGVLSFDDETKQPEEFTCIILNTVSGRNSMTGESGYGYYQLIVKESSEIPGAYERVGVGIALSPMDHIPHGFLGRYSPSTRIVLV